MNSDFSLAVHSPALLSRRSGGLVTSDLLAESASVHSTPIFPMCWKI
ncbi:hypothetical protein [Melghirimyces profundicolus]|nr:hypothetical protein [Melghirimyces profundicolus]